MAYGSLIGVAAYAKMYTSDGSFIDPSDTCLAEIEGTNPTLTEVTAWLEEVSNQVDLALANEWFDVPVLQADAPKAYSAISMYVNQLVADLVKAANNTGRLFTERLQEQGITPMQAALSSVKKWVHENADGFVGLGLSQNRKQSSKNLGQLSVL